MKTRFAILLTTVFLGTGVSCAEKTPDETPDPVTVPSDNDSNIKDDDYIKDSDAQMSGTWGRDFNTFLSGIMKGN